MTMQRYLCCLLSVPILGCCSAVYAAGPNIDPVPHPTGYPGYYVGGKVGAGFFDISNVNVDGVNFTARNSSGLAGGLFAGYRFRPYAAIEVGYDVFSAYNYNANVPNFVNASTNIRRSLYDFDVLARLIAPCSPFYATLAGGLAVVLTSYDGIGTNGDATYAEPKLELGLGMYVSRSVSIGVAYSRIFAGGNFSPTVTLNGSERSLSVDKGSLPNIDLATLNVNVDL